MVRLDCSGPSHERERSPDARPPALSREGLGEAVAEGEAHLGRLLGGLGAYGDLLVDGPRLGLRRCARELGADLERLHVHLHTHAHSLRPDLGPHGSHLQRHQGGLRRGPSCKLPDLLEARAAVEEHVPHVEILPQVLAERAGEVHLHALRGALHDGHEQGADKDLDELVEVDAVALLAHILDLDLLEHVSDRGQRRQTC
mmetsp:Transcript_49541/g.115151  ORF Transcript_49541/g.115151 Transcript_49541/m.115151 type:complete len:200 (+) Transcript_49541:234-833(+)